MNFFSLSTIAFVVVAFLDLSDYLIAPTAKPVELVVSLAARCSFTCPTSSSCGQAIGLQRLVACSVHSKPGGSPREAKVFHRIQQYPLLQLWRSNVSTSGVRCVAAGW
jgi:hypothetical protein